VALLSDALHNLGDVFTTVGVWFGFRASRKPPTERFPYGFGRAEDLAGVIIVAAIWSSAIVAGIESYYKLVSARPTTHLSIGMIAAGVGIVGNQLVARYKLRVGRAIKSAPLIVDARHSWLDAIASAGALIGLIGVAAGFKAADPLAGFAITLLIIHIGMEATRDIAARLMDANDAELARACAAVAAQTPGVMEIVEANARWLGRTAEVRLVVRAPGNLSLVEAHDLGHSIETSVREQNPDAQNVLVTVNPPMTRD
jgi:cation diffusion facilitator family transporter